MGMRKTLVSLIMVLVSAAAVRGEHVPEAGGLDLDFRTRAAVAADIGDWNPYLDLEGRFEGEDNQFRYRSVTAGAYRRVHRNVKVGAFYRLQAGVRHDDDWLDLGGGFWEWDDTGDRYEHLLMADVTPRLLLGRSGVAAAKLRYEYNLSNGLQVLLLRPGYTWFHVVDRQPRWNLGVNYALYFSLNFGDSLLYEHGPYLSWLYHLSDLLKLEVRGDYHTTIWSPGEDSIAAGDSYLVKDRRILLGLGFLLTPRF